MEVVVVKKVDVHFVIDEVTILRLSIIHDCYKWNGQRVMERMRLKKEETEEWWGLRPR